METVETLTEIEAYLHKDTNYKFYRDDNAPGFQINSYVNFEIVNEIPEGHFAPFFKIKSVDDAKEMFKSILVKYMPNTDFTGFDEKFENRLKTQTFSPSSDLHFAVYRIRE